ncbi:MAG: hypothetical protein JNM25_06885 [Planctomycetes bacterium]|nr:hypothetical protein [Planctomycetota bacterium]
MSPHDTPFSPAERDQLEQELLELHFGCHEHPEQLAARLAAEPALRALQQQVLQQADLLARAVRPEQAPLDLATPERGGRPAWWRRPMPRLLLGAAAAACTVLGFFVAARVADWRLQQHQSEHLHLTVSAPKAVPAGAPWTFTVQAKDLRGEAAACRVRWQAFGDDDAVLGAGEAAVLDGSATVTMRADLRVPQRVEVVAATTTDEVRQVLTLSTAAAGPLVHVTTDRPVYRPGEPVFARAVVLDRVTLLPLATRWPTRAQLFDGKDAVVAAQADAGNELGVASFAFTVPAESAGGTHRVEVSSPAGAFAPESVEIVVRPFQTPRLDARIVLDRASYAPGARGSAAVSAERLGAGGVAAGAMATGTLVVDGSTVSSEKKALDARGRATFGFTVPTQVERGAARFVAVIDDGGTIETEVRPFVVPTGEVLVACFPEGGDLVAGVENSVYVECSDALGRPVDTTGELLDAKGERLLKFTTTHQGRVRLAFTPREHGSYQIRLPGHVDPFPLPAVAANGIALRALDEQAPAGKPLRVHVAGRGDGPWLLGVFCRGVLVGQTTLRPNASGALDTVAEVPLPASANGVLRTTVFDRALQPIAERLLRRASAQRIDVELVAQQASVLPGDAQRVTVRTRDERGQPIAAVLGVSVTDQAVASLGSEPRLGLADYAQLFADVARVEDLGDFLLGHVDSARNADLLLGTRGWRKFVWRNDAAAQATIAARGKAGAGVLAREGFSHTPQVLSNLQAARAAGDGLQTAAHSADRHLREAAAIAVIALLLLLLAEGVAWLLRRVMHAPPVLQVFTGLVTAGGVLLLAAFALHAAGKGDVLAPTATAAPMGTWDFEADGGSSTRLVPDPGLLFDHDPGIAFDSGAWNTSPGLGRRAAAIRSMVDSSLEIDVGFARPAGDPANRDIGPVRRFSSRDEDAQPTYFLPVDLRQRQYAHQHVANETRDDFAPTIFWNTLVPTDERGETTISFATSDAVTTWLVQADAHVPSGPIGRVGQASATFTSTLPFHLDARLPDEVSAGDELLLPIAATVDGRPLAEVDLQVRGSAGLHVGANAPDSILLEQQPGGARGRVLVPVTVDHTAATASLTMRGRVGRFTDDVTRTIAIAPRGFPHRRSSGGTVATGAPATTTLSLPTDAVPGSGHVLLKVFPSPISALTEGLAGILQEPHGCFEQASSSNYPNTLVLTLLEANGDDVPLVAARARELLPKGYAKITGYECSRRGYEWFGHDPGHEALTAYGLLQFHDMAKVYDVDAGMVERTQQWLLARRDGTGNYPHQGQDQHGFGGRSVPLTNAYVTYALLQVGTPATELATEIAALVGRMATKDPYELALISCALHLAGRPEEQLTRQWLAELQQADGSLHGTTTSITMSGGRDLVVESTGFAVLAWLPDPAFAVQVRRAVEFLQGARDARGTFGATQATIVALRAMTAYAQQNRTMREPGTLRVFAGDTLLGERAFTASDTDAITFELWHQLAAGDQTLRLALDGGGEAPLPWACDVSYHSERPADDPDTRLSLQTGLRATTVREGDTVGLDVTLTNRTDEQLPMTMAIVGLPAGLELPTRVLEDLQRAERFAFWELRGRELALYWRDVAPRATTKLTLDLVARIPGRSTGPASRTYLYYTPQQKRWTAPLRVEVTAR